MLATLSCTTASAFFISFTSSEALLHISRNLGAAYLLPRGKT